MAAMTCRRSAGAVAVAAMVVLMPLIAVAHDGKASDTKDALAQGNRI